MPHVVGNPRKPKKSSYDVITNLLDFLCAFNLRHIWNGEEDEQRIMPFLQKYPHLDYVTDTKWIHEGKTNE